MRGNGIVSRTCGRPQIHATVRSIPRPNPACGNAPVAAEVEVPLERLARQLVVLDRLHERVEIVLALTAADDLAVPLGREDVHAERELRVGGVALEVERLHRRRVAVDHDGAIEAALEITVSSSPPKSSPNFASGCPFFCRISIASA